MAIVEMKCPNCGSVMQLKNGQFCCPSCRTMMLHIIDAKIDADVSVISPAEFQKKLEESKKSYVIKIEDKIKVFDATTEIINVKIEKATKALEEGDFKAIPQLLQGVPDTILSAERLRLLSRCEVQDESGFIYGADITHGESHFNKIIAMCNSETRETYNKIKSMCAQKIQKKQSTLFGISQALELLQLGKNDSAITHSKALCNDDPTSPYAWASIAFIKCIATGKAPTKELTKMYQMLSLMDDIRYGETLKNICSIFMYHSENTEYDNYKYGNTCTSYMYSIGQRARTYRQGNNFKIFSNAFMSLDKAVYLYANNGRLLKVRNHRRKNFLKTVKELNKDVFFSDFLYVWIFLLPLYVIFCLSISPLFVLLKELFVSSHENSENIKWTEIFINTKINSYSKSYRDWNSGKDYKI